MALHLYTNAAHWDGYIGACVWNDYVVITVIHIDGFPCRIIPII